MHNSQAQALMGAWQQIVGYGQESGQPTNLYHGMYGGHRARAFRRNFDGYGAPLTRDWGWISHNRWTPAPVSSYSYPSSYGPPPGYYGEVPPRNVLVDYPGPTRADRVILPMSSGVNILPNTSAQITARPQNVAFRPERMIVGGAAGDWIINDIKVGNRSQLSQSGDLPGEMFAANAVDSYVSFETVQTAMDFVAVVTNVGASESGSQFVCAVLGTAAV